MMPNRIRFALILLLCAAFGLTAGAPASGFIQAETPAASLTPAVPPAETSTPTAFLEPTATSEMPAETAVEPSATSSAPPPTNAPPADTPAPTAVELTATPSILPPTESPPPTNAPSPTKAPPAGTAIPTTPSLTGVEPGKITRETGGTLSIYGTGFAAGLAVRLVGFGLLDAVVLNSTAIRAVVPPFAPAGKHDIEVILNDGTLLRLEDAVNIKPAPGPTPTRTATPGRQVVYGQPQLLIGSAGTTPDSLRPGMEFSLQLEIVNRGDYTATNVRLALGSPEIAVPKGSSNLIVIDLIDAGQSVAVELPLALDAGVAPGSSTLVLTLEYADYYGREYTSSQSIGLSITNALADQPLVLLAAYHTDPPALSPGDSFTLVLELANVGDSAAQQLLLTLGRPDGTGLSPFAILDSGNVKFIPMLAAGASVQIEQRLVIDGSAATGVFNVPVILAYDSADGTRHSETQVLNLLASRRPQLQIDFYQPVPAGKVGQPLELPIEVVNIARNLVNVSTVQISGAGMEITTRSTFVGALDGGTSGTLDAEVIPAKSGDLTVQVTVNYLDDFNQPQVITHSLSFSVDPEPTPTPPAASPGSGASANQLWDRLLRFLRALLGLGS